MSNGKVVILILSTNEAMLLQKMILSSRVDKDEEEKAYQILVKLQTALN